MSIFRSLKVIRGLASVALIGLVVFVWLRASTPPTVTYLRGQDNVITKVVEVPVETITTKTVLKYVPTADRATVDALMAENKSLEAKVEQLTLSLAEATSTGGGEIVYLPVPSSDRPTIKFSDWRLTFTSDGYHADYSLTQRFSILNSVGLNRKNVPVNVVRLYEIGPNGERYPIPTVETTTIATQANQPRWYMSPSIQLGVTGFVANDSSVGTRGLTVALPWWKRGTMDTAEASRWAVLTPAVVVTDKSTVTVGLLPVSVNLGTVVRSPFKDVWLSPFVGQQGKTRRLGLTLTATF